MNGEPFLLSGAMGQEQMEIPSGVPRAAWLGHLKLCGLINQPVTFQLFYWGLVVFAEM